MNAADEATPSVPPTAGRAPDPERIPPSSDDGLAIASLALGIAGIALSWFIGVVFSVLAIALGWVARARAQRGGAGGRYALAGIVLGAIGALLFAILLLVGRVTAF